MSAKRSKSERVRAACSTLRKVSSLIAGDSAEAPCECIVASVKTNFYEDQPLLVDMMSCLPDLKAQGDTALCELSSLWRVEDELEMAWSDPLRVKEVMRIGHARRAEPIQSIHVGPTHKVDVVEDVMASATDAISVAARRVLAQFEGNDFGGYRGSTASGDDLLALQDCILHDNHIAILVRAWSDILSKIWMEWVEGRSEKPSLCAPIILEGSAARTEARKSTASIDLTFASRKDVEWWRQIMTIDGCTYFVEVNGVKYYSFWDRSIEGLGSVELIANESIDGNTGGPVVSLDDAIPALTRYVKRHGLAQQSWIALGIASWLPAFYQISGLSLPKPMHLMDKLRGLGTSKKAKGIGVVSRRNLMKLVLEGLIWRPTVVQAVLSELGSCTESVLAAKQTLKNRWPRSARQERKLYQTFKSLCAYPLPALGHTGGRGWLGALIKSWDVVRDSMSGFFVAGLWKVACCWTSSMVIARRWRPSISENAALGPGVQAVSKKDEIILQLLARAPENPESVYPYCFSPSGFTRVSVLPPKAQSLLRRLTRSKQRLKLSLDGIVSPTSTNVWRPDLISRYPVLRLPLNDIAMSSVNAKFRLAELRGFRGEVANDQVLEKDKREWKQHGGLLIVKHLRSMAFTEEQSKELTNWESALGLASGAKCAQAQWPSSNGTPPRLACAKRSRFRADGEDPSPNTGFLNPDTLSSVPNASQSSIGRTQEWIARLKAEAYSSQTQRDGRN